MQEPITETVKLEDERMRKVPFTVEQVIYIEKMMDEYANKVCRQLNFISQKGSP